ncbi:MAG: A24 family peptidase [Sphingomonas sp.]
MLMPPLGWALAGGGLGAVAGSYLSTIALRWPQGRAARGRSTCDGCGRTLSPLELVPLLSWALAQGRCRACGGRIDPRHPGIEAACAVAGAAALALAPGPAGLAGALFGWLLIVLAVLDLDHFWLPDRLTAVLAGVGLAGGLAGLPPPLADRLIGGAAGFVALWAIAAAYRAARGREGLGRGDAKLLGAIGLWLGWRALPPVLLGASLCGLVAALALWLAGRPIGPATRLPLGTLMAAAAFAWWLAAAAGVAPS